MVREYRHLIYKICHSYCNNPADHRDLEQDILVQLWIAMPRYNGSVQLSTWIYRIALNTAISFYRKENKRHNIDHDVFVSLVTNEYDTETDRQIRMLYGFIAQLNDLDKALMLLYLEDLRYKDIADILGITESNVATKVNRIKNRLKDFFHNR